MTANTSPIYTLTPDNSTNNGTGCSQPVTAAAASYDGTHANNVLVHTAGSNGSYVSQIRCKASGTCTASVARVFLNNGSTAGTASNNIFFEEINLPATTAGNTLETATVIKALNVRLPSGWRIYVGIATAVSAGWTFTAEAGQY